MARLVPVEESAKEKGKKEKSKVKKFAFNAMQGPLLGWGDELVGLSTALVRAPKSDRPFSEEYTEARDYVRGAQEQYRQENPIIAPLAQVGASLPLAAINPLSTIAQKTLGVVAPSAANRFAAWMAPKTEVIGVGQRAVQGGMSGAGYGAISGAGESEEETMGGVMADAAGGGSFGAVTGGATGAAIKPIQQQVGARLTPKGKSSFAQEKVAEAIVRDARGNVVQSGASNAGTQAVRRMQKLGPEARVVDAGGQNTRQLLDTVATLPGRTKDATEIAIRSRQAGRAGRMTQAADKAMGGGGVDYDVALEAFADQQRRAATPLYDQVQNTMVKIDDKVMSLLKRSSDAHKDAERLVRIEYGIDFDLTKLEKGQSVPFWVLDKVKQSLYDAESAAYRAGNKTLGNSYKDLRRQLTEGLDDISPKDASGQSIYKSARDAFAGPAQMIDAAELGRRAMKEDVFDLKDSLRGMNKSEIEAFRIGALQALREKTGTQSGQTSLLKMWMEPATRDRLKAVFGNDYRKFADAVAKEARLKGLESVGRGSQTAARQFGAGDLDVSPLANVVDVTNAMTSGGPGTFASFLANRWNRVQTPEPVRDEMGKLLLSQDPKTLQQLEWLIPMINQQRARQAGQYGAFAGMPAGLITVE